MKFMKLSLRKRGKSPPQQQKSSDDHEYKTKSEWLLPRTQQDLERWSLQAKKKFVHFQNNNIHNVKLADLLMNGMKCLIKVLILIQVCYKGPGIVTRSTLNMIPPMLKKDIGTMASDGWKMVEKYGLFEKLPKTFNMKDYYYQNYPGLKVLDDNWELIRDETLHLLKNNKDELGTLGQLSKDFFKNNKEDEWRQFFLKMGVMIDENRPYMPKTFELVKQTPEILNLYISVLDPHYNVPPHWKYYKGMVKYHLGLIVPNNNEDEKIFIRVDENIEPTPENLDKNHYHAITPALDSPKYFWHEGEGVLWDDMLYHEVKNDADSVRVIVLADVYRKMPWYLSILNKMMVAVAYMDPDVKEMQKNCIFKGQLEDHSDIALSSAF